MLIGIKGPHKKFQTSSYLLLEVTAAYSLTELMAIDIAVGKNTDRASLIGAFVVILRFRVQFLCFLLKYFFKCLGSQASGILLR